ncbi:mitochondrial carrier family, partial [Micromonas commoda]
LYDGLVPNLLKEGPPLALYLGIYEALKSLLLRNTELAPVFCYLAAGAVGECVGSVVRVPAEAIKSTRQADGSVTVAGAVAKNFGDCKGRSNLIRAWSVAVVRDVPFG